MDGPAYTSLFQASTRWNPFIALAILLKLFGAPGVVLVAVAMAAMIPLINVTNVFVLAAFTSRAAPPLHLMAKTVVLNPLILGCVVGLTVNVLAIPIGDPIMTSLDLLGRAALGTSLLCVGAGLKVGSMLRPSWEVWLGTAIKRLVMPGVVAIRAMMLGLSGVGFQSVIIVAAVPAATSGYILARQMGGDAELYGASIAVQTVASFVSIPALVYVAAVVARSL